jgi:DNA-binding PucR family transcriptional regulator
MEDVKSVTQKTKSAFDKFCEACFENIDADKRVSIMNKFLSPEVEKILADKELAESISSFFSNNLNISETSRNTFVHRNTLVYRIEKIHKLTGLDIRNFEDSVCFRLYMWLTERA